MQNPVAAAQEVQEDLNLYHIVSKQFQVSFIFWL